MSLSSAWSTSQVQPHAEFIKGQRHPNSINDGTGSPLRLVHFCEKKDCRDSREQKDSVVQVMDMRSAKVQKQIR